MTEDTRPAARETRRRRRVLLLAAGLSAAALLVLASVVLVPGWRGEMRSRLREVGILRDGVNWVEQRVDAWRSPALNAAESGDGGLASEIRLQDPVGITADADGRIYVVDRGRGERGRFVWRIDPDGRAHVIAGDGHEGVPEDGALATATSLGAPAGVAIGEGGRLYVADPGNHVVVAIEPDGTLTRVAGTGERGYGGDGGPALAARLNEPFDVRVDSLGNLYIADFANHRIRRVGPDGTIETVAGTGREGYSGDGGPATAAMLRGPYGIFVDPADRLLIADSYNHVIRRVDRAGIISTIAGVGMPGYSGDGGPALEARFNTPQGLFVDEDGSLLISDEHNHAVRRLTTLGTVEGVIGTGRPGKTGVPGPISGVMLNDPENIWVRADRTVLLTDGDNGRVLAIDPDGTVRTFAGGGG